MSATGSRDPQAVYIGSDPTRVDIVVEHATVSGCHCKLFWNPQAKSYCLEDLGSTNGTYLAGARLAANAPQLIQTGTRIFFGQYGYLEFNGNLVVKLTLPASWKGSVRMSLVMPQAPTAVATTSSGAAHAATPTGSQSPRPAPVHRAPSVAATQQSQSATAPTEPSPIVAGQSTAGHSAPPPGSGPVPGTRTLTREELDAMIRAAQAMKGGAKAKEAHAPSVNAASITIGYDEGNDVVVPNPTVSGRHARLYIDNGRFILEDQASLNGTWYGGSQISRSYIEPGDAFALGSYALKLDANLLSRLDAKRVHVEANIASGGGSNQVLRVGREPTCEIVIDAPMVSGLHCSLTPLPSGEGYLVEDGDGTRPSTNGTFLNSRENRIQRQNVSDDDVLFFGSYRFPLSRVSAFLGLAEHDGDEIALPAGKQIIIIGRDADVVDIQIDQPQVSRQHVEIKLLGDGRFEIRDLGSSNGTFVNGDAVSGRVVVGPNDRVSLGSYQLQFDAAKGVVRKQFHGDIMIQANHVSFDVKDKKSPNGIKRILNDISFTVYPTEFVGLMGPSGAGKTTLMMALNGYTPPSNGRSLINGVDLYENYNSFRGNIGYVPQDDIVYPQLTVYESLFYTARLRLPSDTSTQEIDAKITRILEQLEIQQTRDVLIGDAIKKGISGGQRKRVNLAQELITEPSLLFLDEPTSGLASEDTVNVMRMLRNLADSGKTIILTIHQPSLECYRMMDNIIYLFQGNMVFYGATYPDSITFFNPNLPDGPEREGVLADPGNALKPLAQDQRHAFEQPAGPQRDQALTNVIQGRRQQYEASKHHKEYVVDRSAHAGTVAISSGSKQKTDRRGMFRQWGILAQRCARIKWKDRLNTAILMIQAPIIAAVLAAVYAGKVGGVGQYFDTLLRGPSALFLLVASAVWFGCSNSAREIVAEQAIYRRERMVNLMIPSYVLSKFTVLGAVCAVQVFILLTIVYFPLGFEGSFFLMYGMLLLVSLAGLGMGLTLSALVNSGEASVALVPLLLIPQIILGGVIMPVHDLNAPTRALSTTMVARWGFEALLHIEYGNDDVAAMQAECGIPDCHWGVSGLGAYAYYTADPEQQMPSMQVGGVQSVQATQPMQIAPENDSDLCSALCISLANSQELSPMDRSFGVNAAEGPRAEAEQEIARDGAAGDMFTAAEPNARSPWLIDILVLLGYNVMLLFLVMAILKFKDVEVE